jgi:1,2-phenylacetyl-CoA epoxidase catalytic subunit
MIAYNDCDSTAGFDSNCSMDTYAQLLYAQDEDKGEVFIEDLIYIREERSYYNSLFRAMFKTKLLLHFLLHTYSMLYYCRLMFSVSGWLNRKARGKRG